MNQTAYDTKEPSWITKFLWWCAGADRHFLLLSPMEDRVKYAGIGGIVFATGVLAALAGGFAFVTAFGPKSIGGEEDLPLGWKIASIVFGIIWGLIIFNMDRFIVSSTGKGDGTDAISGKELLQALPRLFIALVLGITISKPLELKIIETEINAELRVVQENKRAEYDKLTREKYKGQIAIIDADLKKLEEQRIIIFDLVKTAQQEYYDQLQGRAGSIAGDGPRAKKLEQLWIEKQKELDEFDKKHTNEIGSLKNRREELLKIQEKELNETNFKQAAKMDGLLARLSIAHDKAFTLGIALLFIFLSIEMGPIFFKMMMTKGVYDFMVENNRDRKRVESGIYREDHVYEGKNGLIHMEKWRYLDVELARNEKLKKTQSQDAINAEVIRQWETKKIEEIKSNPTKFFTEGNDSLPNNNA